MNVIQCQKEIRDKQVDDLVKSGMVLIQDDITDEGHTLTFGTPEEHAALFPTTPEEEIASLKQQVSDLQSQVESLSGRVISAETDVSSFRESMMSEKIAPAEPMLKEDSI